MKVGMIRCIQTEDYYPGTGDFQAIRIHTGAFQGEDDIEVVGFINCGGCPGQKWCCVPAPWSHRGAMPLAFQKELLLDTTDPLPNA